MWSQFLYIWMIRCSLYWDGVWFSHLSSIAWVLEYFYCSVCGENVLDEQNTHEKNKSFYFYENEVIISKWYKKLLPETEILKPSLCFRCFRARGSLTGKTFFFQQCSFLPGYFFFPILSSTYLLLIIATNNCSIFLTHSVCCLLMVNRKIVFRIIYFSPLVLRPALSFPKIGMEWIFSFFLHVYLFMSLNILTIVAHAELCFLLCGRYSDPFSIHLGSQSDMVVVRIHKVSTVLDLE